MIDNETTVHKRLNDPEIINIMEFEDSSLTSKKP